MKKDSKLAKVYPWIVVALLWVVALLNYMDRQMLSTMRESMQIDITELESAVNFGRLMAIFLWIYGGGLFCLPVTGLGGNADGFGEGGEGEPVPVVCQQGSGKQRFVGANRYGVLLHILGADVDRSAHGKS